MKQLLCLFTIGSVLVAGSGFLYGGEKAPQKIVDYANSKLIKWGSDSIIVNAVKTENAKGKSLDQIKELDKKWMATPGVDPFMKSLMDSPCGKHLQGLQKSAPFLAEIFVMDNQGANVCMSDKTSDFWQGDEPKFVESFKSGNGAVHISDVSFDKSTQAYLVQASVPVKDGGKVIGALTIGINVDKFK
ncbi:MAG: PDC sensor domain-containing protein [Thermodesulfobacteriota bacterium]